jgi:hypothetical protein
MSRRTVSSRPRPPRGWRTVLPLVLAAAGCAAPARREAGSLLAAVDRYQRADNASKAALVQAVAAVACSDQGVCDAKRACLDAIEPTAQALALKDEVSARVDDLQAKRLAPDAPEAQALPGKLDLATKLLGEGRSKMPACEKKLADLRVAYGP